MLTLAQLRTLVTVEAATEHLIATLADLGFDTTSWQSGSVQRKLLTLTGIVWNQVSQVIVTLTDQLYNETATSDFLTAFSASHYANTRLPAVATTGQVVLTCSAAAGPYTIAASELVFSDSAGRTFRNTGSGTLNSGSTLTLAVVAEVPGAAGNVANNTITTLVTSRAGVTVANPAIGSTGTWILTLGEDAESDTRLRSRNTTKWSSYAMQLASEGVRFYAYKAANAVTRVAVRTDNPGGPGTVWVYLAGASGPAAGGDVTTVQTALNLRSFGNFTAYAATAQPIAVSGRVYYSRGYTAAGIQAAVETAIAGAINAAPIGGYDLSPGPTNVIPKNDLEDAIANVTGVRTVALTTPAADIGVPTYSVATVGTLSITYIQLAS